MDKKELFLSFLRSESERDVQQIIESHEEFCDPGNWKPLGGHQNNFATTMNQASDGDKALTELMTNMVDAILMKYCYKKGIDPKGTEAPKTMYEAVKLFFAEEIKIHGGKLRSLANLQPGRHDPWLMEFAKKNLVIGVTGSKRAKTGNPCITLVDNGEGQDASRFEDTFLSFNTDNQEIVHKDQIPFVQGKFHMGSSGVFMFCGNYGFKLIASRRFDKKNGEWGWTLVRGRPSNGEDGLIVAEYFIPYGEIPSFCEDSLYPFCTSKGEIYRDMMLNTGTIIKLFTYKTKTFPSTRGTGIDRILYENLVETILPFRILDFRETPVEAKGRDREQGVDPRPFYGLEFFLLENYTEDDGKIRVGSYESPDMGKIIVSAIHLKEDASQWILKTKHRVFHTVNGQVHYKELRGRLTSCGFSGLKDNVVIFVDASDLLPIAHRKIWKSDRESILKTDEGEKYLEEVKKVIENSQPLKDLDFKLRQQALKNLQTTGHNEVFQKLVDSDQTFADFLSQKDPSVSLRNQDGKLGRESKERVWDGGKKSPTFVRLEKTKNFFEISAKGYPIKCTTDAENNYLDRAEFKGKMLVASDIEDCFERNLSLKDGMLYLSLKPLEGKVDIGNSFITKIGLEDETMSQAVETEEITLKITEPKEEKKKGGEKEKIKREPSGQQKGLPHVQLLTKNGEKIEGYNCEKWPEGENFNEYDGGEVKDLGEGELIYRINYDNAYLIEHKKKKKDIEKKKIDEQYILGMRILMLGYENAFNKRCEDNLDLKENMADHQDEFRRMTARGAASTVLTIIKNFPELFDSAQLSDDEDV
jgi:hypothetical protein